MIPLFPSDRLMDSSPNHADSDRATRRMPVASEAVHPNSSSPLALASQCDLLVTIGIRRLHGSGDPVG
jgi:hypothetical protein